ncbi:MAG: glycoside hydrolase family 97 protein [Paludibacteraceae bacterium]|nr:glycoside hydrolase family 97 protein [Paludibacteraceae bacterium]
MKKLIYLLIFSLLGIVSCSRPDEVTSPDGRNHIHFELTADGTPTYTVVRDGKTVIEPSALGFVLENADLTRGFEVKNSYCSSLDETWTQVWGEERDVRNHYNELVVELKGERLLTICFRAYDDGVALRYIFPREGDAEALTVTDEKTEYRFAEEPEAWSIGWRTSYYEGLWKKAPISEKDTACSPITLEMANGTYAFLHEAALTDFPAQALTFEGSKVGTYLIPWLKDRHALDARAYIETGFQTPWRFLILADNLHDLIGSRLMLNLNEPCQIEDTSWIRPMKFIGIWWGMHMESMTWKQGPIHGATTTNMTRYMQFAKEHNIGGVLAEGWNLGWEDWSRFYMTRPYDDYDIDSISRLSAELGVEVIGHNETGGNAALYETELEEAYAYHQEHGIHAIKTGYVSPIIRTLDGPQYNRSQSGVRHYRKVIETAAKYHIAIDNHEPVMPTGLQRTFPNLMTQEGVRGQEWNAWSRDGGSPCEHVTVLPFTRVMAGPVDYTPGVFAFENPVYPQTRVHSTLMNQLALFVVIYSPLQMACDLPENYMKHPDAFRFIEHVPCDWSKSTLLDGKIGDYVVMARRDRNSDNWYLGAITDEQAREFTVSLDFLDEGNYTAIIYRDGDGADWENAPYDYQIEEKTVNKADSLTLRLATGGGCAIEFVKM